VTDIQEQFEMKMGALAPWFGSKRTLAPRIIAELGEHRAYWELFAGSMAVTLAKPPASMETVNDLHGDLINLSRVVQDQALGPVLYRRLRRALNSQDQFVECRASVLVEPAPASTTELTFGHVRRAFDYFVCSWQGMNGVAGTASYNMGFARRFTKNGGHAAKRFAGAVDSIPAWRRRLRAVSILSCDGIELAEKIEDSSGVVIYADPPYLVKGAKYLHDFDWLAHRRLAKALNRFKKTRVVVSYYAHPDLDAMYPGWTTVDCTMTKSMVSQGRRDKANDTVSPEVLLINGPSYTANQQ
jgi:DNA adenine methylase